MRPLLNTLGYLALAFPGGALLAPLAWVAVHGDMAPLSFLDEHDDFHRFVTRSIMIFAVLGMWPLLKMNNMDSLGAIGLNRPDGIWRRFAFGLGLGIGSFAVLAIIGVFVSPMEWSIGYSFAEWMGHLKNAGLAAILVSLIEEFLFRGVLFGAIRRSLNWRWAAVFTSLIFSAVHFLNAKPPNPENMNPLMGLITMSNMIHGPTGDPQWAARFVNLFLAGLVLAGSYQKTGSLYLSMAIHGGWILGGKTVGFITKHPGDITPIQAALFGRKELLEGWVMTPLLLAIVVWIFLYQKGRGDSITVNNENIFIP